MATEQGPRSALEELCERSNVPYAPELAAQTTILEQLAQLAQLAQLVTEPTPIWPSYPFLELKTTPSQTDSYSRACEHHPERNEDNSFELDIPGNIHAIGVFDGLGGRPGSERASAIAAESVEATYSQTSSTMTREQASELAITALRDAEQKVLNEDPYIATTVAVASIHTDPESGVQFASIAWAGDSRVFVVRGGVIIYRTRDDSEQYQDEELDKLLQELYPDEAPEYRAQALLESCIDIYEYSPELLPLFRFRNIIDNCIGDSAEPATIHTSSIDVQPGDIILATSDGIHDNLTNNEIAALIAQEASMEYVVQAALERSRDKDHQRSKPDDMTAVILQVPNTTRNSRSVSAENNRGESTNSYCYNCGQTSPSWSSTGASGCMYCGYTASNS